MKKLNKSIKIQYVDNDEHTIKIGVGQKYRDYEVFENYLTLYGTMDRNVLPQKFFPLCNIRQIDITENNDFIKGVK